MLCPFWRNIFTAKIPSKSSNKGIAKIGLPRGNGSIVQYFSDLNLVSELQGSKLPEKACSKSVKLDKRNEVSTATVSCGCGI